MDEILASIRRIIESGDEQPGAAAAAKPERGAHVERLEASAETGGPVVARLSPELPRPSVTTQDEAAEAFDFGDEAELARRLREELEDDELLGWSELTAALSQESGGTAPAAGEDAGSQGPATAESATYESRDRPFVAANSDMPFPRDFGDMRAGAEPEVAVPLTSSRTGELVGASFDALGEAIREGQIRSMDEMAEDLLRPMLREWLDDNLPKLVERLVREEIDRVARGGRR